MNNIGLVLQGGGVRGVYTSGVLDFFMEQNLYFPYIAAVSAGACNGAAYLSRQNGLGKIMHIKFLRDPRYMSIRNLFKHRSLIGMDFIFDEIPKKLEPFDFKAFHAAKEHFVVAATNCQEGSGCYFDNKGCKDIFKAIRASCSVPFITQMVEMEGMQLLDGGITVPIPIHKSLSDGHNKNVVILTCTEQREPPSKHKWLSKQVYPRIIQQVYPSFAQKIYASYHNLVKALIRHQETYRNTLNQIQHLENTKKAFVIRPSRTVNLKAMEKNQGKLEQLYNQGYEDASNQFIPMLHWMNEAPS